MRHAFIAVALAAGAPMASAQSAPKVEVQQGGTTQRLQAVSPVSDVVVWASGTGGTFALTTDGGTTWRSGRVPGADSLEFRDVQGVSDRTAYLLSSGNGAASRIYRTDDGGATWTLQFQNADSAAFYDCFAFWDANNAIAMSDQVKGRFPVLRTADGKTWVDIGNQMPAAQEGEGAFAASGTCVATHGREHGWISTGAAAKSRILLTTDRGDTWSAHDVPIVQGTATSGSFSIAFRDSLNGIVVGGDLQAPGTTQNVARSSDGGRTWKLATSTPFAGAAFGVAYAEGKTVVATGPGGAAWSTDEGATWTVIPDQKNYWAVAFAGRTGWLVGTGGRILKVRF